MLQRIQTVFLFLAGIAAFALFGVDFAETGKKISDSILFSDGHFNLYDDPILMGLFAAAGVVFLVSVFLFKNRSLQTKVSLLGVLLSLGGLGYAAYKWFTDVASAIATPDLGVFLVAAAVILGVLARNYIRRDEKLVRSADRLR